MAQEKLLSGCAAAAQGAKFAEVEVICSFPIRPYTAIMNGIIENGCQRGTGCGVPSW